MVGKGKALVLGLLGTAAVAGTVWGGYSYRAALAKPAETQVPGVVRRGDLAVRISGTAPLAAAQVETVKAEVTGTVAEHLAAPDERLAAGQPVLRLENPTLAQQARQAAIDLQNEEMKLRQITDPDPADVQAARIRVQQAELTVSTRRSEAEKLDVTAPVTGTVKSLAVDANAEVSAGAVLLTLTETVAPRVDVTVSQLAAPYIQPGQQAEVELDGVGTLDARVSAITPGANGGAGSEAAARVELALPEVSGIQPGMAATVTIFTRHPDFPTGVTARGSVPAAVDVAVKASVAGRVALATSAGSQVATGATLARLANSQMPLALTQAEHDLVVAKQQLATLIDPSADRGRSAELATQANRVEQARLNRDKIATDQSKLVVRAPFAGTITDLPVMLGQQVAVGAAVFTLADHDAFQLVIPVDELDIPQIHLEQATTVEADAFPGKTYRGTVTKISREGKIQDGVSTFDVTVRVTAPAGLLPGMNALAEIAVAERQDVLLVPSQALVMRSGQALVRRYQPDGTIEMARVEPGLRTDDLVEVMSGLREGDRIVTAVVTAPQTTAGGLPGVPGAGAVRIPGGVPGLQGGGGFRPSGSGQGGANTGSGGNRSSGAQGGSR